MRCVILIVLKLKFKDIFENHFKESKLRIFTLIVKEIPKIVKNEESRNSLKIVSEGEELNLYINNSRDISNIPTKLHLDRSVHLFGYDVITDT